MKNIFLGLIAVSIVIVSCKKDERATYIEEEASVQSNAVANSPQTSLLDQTGISNQNVATAAAPGMNPAHGQPGHRCDIPVGQPLNSKPAPTAQTTPVNSVPNAVQIDPNTLPAGQFVVPDKKQAAKTAPGMNPPHGEPGHRCNIPVGQPLNSKPAPQTTPANVVQSTPAPAPQQTLATGEKPKLNPPHGQPFHSCSLKVGDPLP
ncbi:MAG: hypothetical protein WCJ72_01965 [Chryseobacterium sp.]